ncbi:MAG: DUF502 domain-containing protein [Balneolaceae bacterium]|nr:MAG: DUF502 domain-containing protein [Balneolaceae bacterium]
MTKFNNFIRTSMFGGLVVLMPIILFFLVVRWVYGAMTDVIYPLTSFLVEKTALQQLLADILVIAFILIICFAMGVFVKTQMGNLIFRGVENATLRHAPGYSMIKETVMMFFGRSKSPFSAVALVRPFSSETMMTAFVTDEHPGGSFTVFIPTAPNPTSGNIYHLPKERVHIVDVPVDEALRTILSCGIGSTNMIVRVADLRKKKPDQIG